MKYKDIIWAYSWIMGLVIAVAALLQLINPKGWH